MLLKKQVFLSVAQTFFLLTITALCLADGRVIPVNLQSLYAIFPGRDHVCKITLPAAVTGAQVVSLSAVLS